MTSPSKPSPVYADLMPGDPAPWFHQRSTKNPSYAFDMAAGRYIVLCFYASAADEPGRSTIQKVLANRHYFDDDRFSFFGVSRDPTDETEGRVSESLPGIRFFWDFDGKVSRLYGAIPKAPERTEASAEFRRFWIVLDPTLRVLFVVPFSPDGSDASRLFAHLEQLPPPDRFAGTELQAPILFLPNVFEPDLCDRLIDLFRQHGGEESGFMRDVEGKTVAFQDHSHKRRRDYTLNDPDLISGLDSRIARRLYPELLKAYSFKATHTERYLVGCYSADEGGHFRAHRDNTTRGTAHRRFAVSINLNSDFEGGALSFPEYGPRAFTPPIGGAVVFPCALLHAVSPVTKGRRYAFLPFLYDDEAAELRDANRFLLDT
jgi:peroxiredoxin/predicted 2-oxoglutarate/Fe(II)-dependent dioxygenase YbiX